MYVFHLCYYELNKLGSWCRNAVIIYKYYFQRDMPALCGKTGNKNTTRICLCSSLLPYLIFPASTAEIIRQTKIS